MSADLVPFELDEVFDRRPPRGDAPLLVLEDVSVHFSGIVALSGLDLQVGQHDVVAIIGPNGAGKTTLLNAICGIVGTTGKVTFGDRDITGLTPSSVAAAGIGRSFQDPPVIDHYSVLENVLCGAHLRLGYRMFDQIFRRQMVVAAERTMTRRAMMLLEFMGLRDVAHDDAGGLPYGARKRVDIARAMLSGPHLLLLDEPSSGLDAHERGALESMLVLLREEECVGILAVEHHMDLVRATATRVLALQAGQELMTGPPDEVLDSDLFRAAVVGGHADDPSVPLDDPSVP
jgi:branched-chain amino acid transport system ATP-binding protein